MAITKEEKANYIQKYAKNSKDSGSLSAQIAILTHRINYITEHLKIHSHDEHTKRGLINLVNDRKSKLKYLKRKNEQAYAGLMSSLGIRA